jgi:hypothetical protein
VPAAAQPTVVQAPVDGAALSAPVRSVLGDPGAVTGAWSSRPLTAGGSGALIWLPEEPDRRRPDHPYCWAREARAYGSGLLTHPVPGFRAARCHGVDERPDGERWLWLEYLEGADGPEWSVRDYALAARRIGRFNGVYAAGRGDRWLARDVVRRRTAATAAHVARVPALREHPLLRRVWPGDMPERVLRLWHHRERLCAFLDTLPRVLGQGDSYRGNLALEPTPDGQELVALDWGLVGVLPLGADLDRLAAGSTAFCSPIGELGALNEAVLDGYAAGLRDAGWRGDERLARRGHAVATALLVGTLPLPVLYATVPGAIGQIEGLLGRPFEEIVERFGAVQRFVVDRGEAWVLVDG